MKNLFLATLVACAAFVSSCSVTMPVAATSNPVGSKVGVAKSSQILGIFWTNKGDLGIQAAAKSAGITKISTVDIKSKLVFLNIVISWETIVTGE